MAYQHAEASKGHMSICGSDVILYDSNSQFAFSEILEGRFVSDIFDWLQRIMGAEFEAYEWWVFSQMDGKAVPRCLHEPTNKPRVLFWLSDERGGIPNHISKHFLAIFKSCMFSGFKEDNIFDFPLGVIANWDGVKYKNLAERDISIYFDGNLNKNRASIYQALTPILRILPSKLNVALLAIGKRLTPSLIRRDFSDFLPDARIVFNLGFNTGDKRSYVDCLSSARIALCPAGFFGPETFRHLEAMRSGCVVISPKLPNKYLYTGSPIVQVNNWNEGLAQARRLIGSPKELEELHRQTFAWWENVCSEEATARRVARLVQNLAMEKKKTERW